MKKHVYIVFNKPPGVVCSHANQKGDKTIFDILPPSFSSLKIAGRLDKDSEGLLVLSSDGEFIQALSHPKNQKEKEYIITLSKPIPAEAAKKLTEGVALNDGLARAKSARSLPAKRVQVILTEGRKRQLRRMFDAIGYPVKRLERVRVGNYQNHSLQPGKHIFIKPEEVLQ
jgi:23S rRNA pseudouridine2605 synthase